jgi:GTP-binding protein Era
MNDVPDDFRSGFVTMVGRPNVGKSTLINQILGRKVSIVSDKPQTTRSQVRGVMHRPGTQIVFVDTPGIHRPRGPLGERLNASAADAIGDVDVVCLVVEATASIGPGDRFIAQRCPPDTVVVVNKVDLAQPDEVLAQLAKAASQFTMESFFPVSATTGEGVTALVDHLVARLPAGPPYYPPDMVTDVPEAFWVAELVREKLLGVLREELPHSIATRVTEWDWPRVRCEILVERDSQKGIVIGRRGSVLKQVGTEVRAEFDERMFLELHVTVDKDWQRRPRALERLGY